MDNTEYGADFSIQPHDRVTHPKYGIGTVQPIGFAGFSGSDPRWAERAYPTPRTVVVQFNDAGRGVIGTQVRTSDLTRIMKRC